MPESENSSRCDVIRKRLMAEEKKLDGRNVCLMGALSDSPGGTSKSCFFFHTALAPEKGPKVSAGKGIYDIDMVPNCTSLEIS